MKKCFCFLIGLASLTSCVTVGGQKVNTLEVMKAMYDDQPDYSSPVHHDPNDKAIEAEAQKDKSNSNDSAKEALLKYKRK